MAATSEDTQPSGTTPGGIVGFLLARIAAEEAALERSVADARNDGSDPEGWSWVRRERAQCRAKRAIVEDVAGRWFDSDYDRAVQHLAEAYADHPDYDESWRP